MDNGINNLREFGKFRLDAKKLVLLYEGKPVNLAPKEIELLAVLTETAGEVVTKSDLLDRVWRDSFVEESNLSRHVYVLRKMFKDLGVSEDLIKTVPRRGYRFAGQLRPVTNGELVIEKLTKTHTTIEFQEEKREPAPVPTGSRSAFKRAFLSQAVAAVLLSILVGSAAYFGYQYSQAGSSSSRIKSIAVLPFRTINGDTGDAHHDLGMADLLVTRLSGIGRLTVRPMNAVYSFADKDPLDVGGKLKVEAILEGTIYRSNDKVRVTARLLKVSDGSSLWTGEFERPERDELSLQSDIALRVAGALALNLSGNEKTAVAKRHTENLDAYQLYVKGRYEWNKRGWQGMLDAERLFRSAIEIDPGFALAYVGLADTMAMNVERSMESSFAIEKALELDPNLAEAHASRGFIKTFHEWEWREAEASLVKSIELNSNYAPAHHWYAQVLTIQGRHQEAKAAMHRALEINPLSHNFLADLGQIYYFNREYKEAEEYCRKALEIYPDFVFAHEYLHDIYLQTGEYDRAVEEQLAADKIFATFANQPAQREKDFETYLERDRKIYSEGDIKRFVGNRSGQTEDGNGCYVYATRDAFVGENEKALACLEKAYAGRAFLSAFVKADPVFDNLRGMPSYQEILRKMNLAE